MRMSTDWVKATYLVTASTNLHWPSQYGSRSRSMMLIWKSEECQLEGSVSNLRVVDSRDSDFAEDYLGDSEQQEQESISRRREDELRRRRERSISQSPQPSPASHAQGARANGTVKGQELTRGSPGLSSSHNHHHHHHTSSQKKPQSQRRT